MGCGAEGIGMETVSVLMKNPSQYCNFIKHRSLTYWMLIYIYCSIGLTFPAVNKNLADVKHTFIQCACSVSTTS